MSELATIAARKSQAAQAFAEAGLPNRRVEEWKYTDLKGVLTGIDLACAGACAWRVDGLPDGVELIDLSKSSLPDWVEARLGSLNGADAPGNASLAFASAGFALRVPAGVDAGAVSLHISGAGHLRTLVLLEAGASLGLAEVHEGDAAYRNVGMELFVGEGAALSHMRLAPRREGVTTQSVKGCLEKDARYAAHYADFGGKLSRLDLHLAIAGEGVDVRLSGVAALGGADHADVTTHIEHRIGNGTSTQLFKYLVGDHARGVYQGRITVREGADGTDSSQTARAFLAGDRAEADLKPELFIYAEDVQCAHGAAIGDLDPEALYYMRTRGIGETEARDLLIRAFLGEAVDEIADAAWRETVWQAVEAAIPHAMVEGV